MGREIQRILVGKTKGKRPIGRPRCWLEDNDKMDIGERGWEFMDWIHVTRDRDSGGLLWTRY
jgi:hypothetical protein